MSEWKPGDVAMVTALNRKTPYRAYLDVDASGGDTWREYGGVNSCLNSPATIRPLVVIDPEDEADVDRIANALREHGDEHIKTCLDWLGVQAALREFAAPTPPKPAEPQGLGAVVMSGDQRYVKVTDDHDWQNAVTSLTFDWSDLDGPFRVLSEGVTP